MSWYKIELTVKQQSSNEISIIQNMLDKIWMAVGAPKGFTLWASKETPTILYLSPEASKISKDIIKKYNGTSCSRPTLSEVAFLLGHVSDQAQLSGNF